MKDILLKAVENDFVLEIEDETLGFLNESPKTSLHTYAVEEEHWILPTQ